MISPLQSAPKVPLLEACDLATVPHFPSALLMSVKVKKLKNRPPPVRELSTTVPSGSSSHLGSFPFGAGNSS